MRFYITFFMNNSLDLEFVFENSKKRKQKKSFTKILSYEFINFQPENRNNFNKLKK